MDAKKKTAEKPRKQALDTRKTVRRKNSDRRTRFGLSQIKKTAGRIKAGGLRIWISGDQSSTKPG